MPSMRSALLVGPLLALASCTQPAAPEPEPQPLPAVTVIEGRLATPAGATQVSVPGAPEVTASVAADGRFSLTLPTAEQLSGKLVTSAGLLSALQCTGTLQSSDPAAQGFAVAALSLTGGERQGGLVYAAEASQPESLSLNVAAQAWVFADRATNLSGEVNCAPLLNVPAITTLPITVSVALLPGWNPVTLTGSATVNIFGVFAGGVLGNSTSVLSPTVWRTLPELQAQISIP